jgi:DHA1 family tetracycline resistance protein-like MFS transporter
MSGQQAGKHALAFIFITILIDSMGLGIILPVLPKLIATLVHGGMDVAAVYGAWLSFSYAGMLFLFSPLLGNLSDRFGRRPVLIFSLVGICIDYTIMGFAPNIAWLFVGRLLSGFGGASYTAAAAYIADVSPPEKRAQNFGLIGAAFGIGFVVGPALGGVVGEYGVRLPFFVAAGLALCNALYGLLVLKESHGGGNRRKFELWRSNPLGALLVLKRFPIILPLCAVLVLMRIAHDANPVVFSYYTMEKFGWGPKEVGWSLVAVGIIVTIGYSTLPRLVSRIGERNAVYIGLLGGALCFTGYAFSTAGWMIFIFMVPFGLMSLAMPAINAIMSNEVGPKEQGELQGALTSLGGLTSVVAPLLLGNLFAFFSSRQAPVYFPGAAFLASALCLVLAAVLFAVLRPVTRAPSL